MKTVLAALMVLPVLGGCELLQGSYDSQVRSECRELPTPDERLACDRAATDAERQRRADELGR